MNLGHQMQRDMMSKGIDMIVNHVNKDRERGLVQLVDITEKIAGDMFQKKSYDGAREMFSDPNAKWTKYINKTLDEINPHVFKMNALNLGFEAAWYGTKTIRKNREVYQCNIPWVILMDPTSACNLRCTGCWAAEYGHEMSLSYETLESIVKQGRDIGTYFYMLTGGEPLMRKKDIIKLAKEFNDCAFHIYTNGTLIDDEFCKECVEVGNITFALSLEGFEETNDARRGKGTYDKVLAAMDLMKKYGLLFGTSICYTSKNYSTVTSDEFLDLIIDHGCRFSWYFNYMPVGKGADLSLLCNPQQREYMYHRIREIRGKEGGKPIYVMDFQNDGEFVGGCIAGGRNYCHINANGDVEPCVFIHYSSANIKEKTLLECLHQPLFMAYRDGQPFNKNQLRPCPMLENPELLKKMVADTGAHSTEFLEPESADELCAKCSKYAMMWKPKAGELWANNPHHKQYYENYKKENRSPDYKEPK